MNDTDVYGYLRGKRNVPLSDYDNTNYTYQTYDYETNHIIEK